MVSLEWYRYSKLWFITITLMVQRKQGNAGDSWWWWPWPLEMLSISKSYCFAPLRNSHRETWTIQDDKYCCCCVWIFPLSTENRMKIINFMYFLVNSYFDNRLALCNVTSNRYVGQFPCKRFEDTHIFRAQCWTEFTRQSVHMHSIRILNG
jgi:hypothetical protein